MLSTRSDARDGVRPDYAVVGRSKHSISMEVTRANEVCGARERIYMRQHCEAHQSQIRRSGWVPRTGRQQTCKKRAHVE